MTIELSAAFRLLHAPIPKSAIQAAQIVKRGLPYKSMAVLAHSAELTVDQVQSALAIPMRTLSRRKASKIFNADESASLVRFARILAYAWQVLGTREAVAAWLVKPNRALGGRVPLSLLDTELGAEAVEDVLGRIDYGVIS